VNAEWFEQVGLWMLLVAFITSIIIMAARENSTVQGVAVWTALWFGSCGVILALGGWIVIHAG
jgi:cytochrome bd-type quinol oxidase subunit 1